MWSSFVLLCVIACVRGDETEWRQIETLQGPVRGRRDPAGLYIFNNIPYATVPSGPNKFGAPRPPPIWVQPLENSNKPIACPQPVIPLLYEDKVIQEDCLVANVYVPITEETNLPVVVYVHGGAFELGYGDMLTPKNFVKQNEVIVVTFNYRLGVHGFLCLGTDDIPGNAGLKDQVQLLQWVKKHIASYGGNPNDVTIAGYSAGSTSVDLLMLSKSAQGLFNKVIQESGVSVASIAVQTNPLEGAKILARKLNFSEVDDIYALEEFYKNTPLEMLLGSTFTDRTDASIPFGPCVERKSNSAFLSDAPVNIIKKKEYKQVPILIGFTNLEGSIMTPLFETWKNKMNDNFSAFLPADLHFENKDQREEIANSIKKFYFGDRPVSENAILSYIDYFSDVLFVHPTLRSVQLHADSGHQEIYLYEYSFTDPVHTPFVPYTEERRAVHVYQTFAILDRVGFLNITDESQLSEEFKNMKRTMRDLWNNFVRYGKPVPEESLYPSWPSAGANGSPYMSLGQTMELRRSPLESSTRFWDDIYQKYYREPTPPPNPPKAEL